MQTRKKVLPRSSSREHINTRSCRLQKKMTVISEKKVTELITSSAKKQKSVGIPLKQNTHAEPGRNLGLDCFASQNENQISRYAHQIADSSKDLSDVSTTNCMPETIFSPAFHHHKDISGGTPEKELSKIKDKENNQSEVPGSKSGSFDCHDTLQTDERFMKDRSEFACESNINLASSEASAVHNTHSRSQDMETKKYSFCDDEYRDLGNLSSEVSAIYLAMQNSKLECIDEQSQDTISTDGCVEPDESDDFDDFDPYLFIKDLPALSAVVPRFRPMLLPKQTRSCPSMTLVLDLDETLVHSTLEPCEDADFTFPVNFNLKEHTIYVRCRPYLKDFLEKVASLFETIIFTASQSIYAEQLLNVLDPKRKLFRHRVYRESCVFVDGNYLKDLSVLGRDLARVIIVDNSPQAFGFQLDNGIPIESWFDNRKDRELLSLLPFLESLVGVDDVRPHIAKRFNLREKVAAASCLSIDFRR
ncbi:CTD small phosphatase-like protein 2 isoform X1 [Canna indica]|uniref:CTD small phosphatase-like protein 2 isoform X1 n=1 Tax=Canna indica TaxID=4628 RepID=A0AAQ3KZJ2_9LILI|nr:CTD small phosphatase-like protein 2 isoform X1 [Canna indica]